MEMDKKTNKLLNDQLNRERFNEALYLSAATYFRKRNLENIANWLELHSKEENSHAMRFYNFIDEDRGEIEIYSLDQPKKFKSILEVWQTAIEAEEATSKHIQELADYALDNKKHHMYTFALEFVKEQIEEESLFEYWLDRFTLAGDDPAALLTLDRECSHRAQDGRKRL